MVVVVTSVLREAEKEGVKRSTLRFFRGFASLVMVILTVRSYHYAYETVYFVRYSYATGCMFMYLDGVFLEP